MNKMKGKKVRGNKREEIEAETTKEKVAKEAEEKEEKEEQKAKEEGEKFDFQLETVTHAEHVTPVLEAKAPAHQEFRLENSLENVETKNEKEKKRFRINRC